MKLMEPYSLHIQEIYSRVGPYSLFLELGLVGYIIEIFLNADK